MPPEMQTQETGAGDGGGELDAFASIDAALATLPEGGIVDDDGGDEQPANVAELETDAGDSDKKKTEAEPNEDAETDEEKDKKPKRKTRAELEAFLLSEEQTATPEGREKAREYLRDRSAQLDGFAIRLKTKGQALASARTEFDTYRNAEEARLEGDRAYARKLAALARKLDDPENMTELVNAIGTITNRDGRDIWERWTRFALAGGKRAEVTTGEQRALERVTKLEDQVMRLVDELRNGGREQQAEAAERELSEIAPRVQQLAGEILGAAGDAEKYPALAPYTALKSWHPQIIADYRRIKREAREKGQKLDRAAVLGRLNGELARLARAGVTPADPAGARPANRVTERVTSIAPSQSRTGGAIREMTQQEREDDLARDSDTLASWFGGPT
jgi:hypothetical protein